MNLGNNLGSRFVPHGNLPNENARYFNRIASWNLCGHVGSSFDLSSIDAMEPVQFEDWVLRRLKDVGHKVSRTPKSHDHGADGIAYHRISGRTYIIQCKHTQRTTSPDQAIGDLLRAQASYGLRDPGLVAVTNATGFGRSATAAAKSSGIRLISRTELERWPFMLD